MLPRNDWHIINQVVRSGTVFLCVTRKEVLNFVCAFTAFGVGRTSCFGKYLAYQEISLVVAQTIWLFDMRTEPESNLGEGSEKLGARRERPKEFQTWGRFVSMHDGPMLQFKRRKI